MNVKSHVQRLSVVAAVTAAMGLCLAPVASAADSGGGVHVLNTETVQVYLSPDGDIQSKRIYEQLALTGHGSVDLKNPVSTDGLRNLDGFGGLSTKDGEQVVKSTVDGTKNYRSVSNFDHALPIKVIPSYYLDGKRVSASDIVGKSGRLQVKFDVQNLTTKKQQVSFSDGAGHMVTKTVSVPVPMVGSLSTTAPSTFTNIKTGGANTAGDGEGGTQISYTMTLFPPLGSTSAEFGYTADITNGVVPEVDVALLPVDPLASPTFQTAADSYQGGAATGAKLTSGATEINTNLLKLRDGAATLLAGLVKLNSGADQLHTGLADVAAPGAVRLASGTDELKSGLGKLSAGAGQLSAGTGKLADGTGSALAGSKKLTSGLKKISGGLGQLAGQLPSASDGITQLKAGVDQLIAGIGPTGDPAHPGILDGLAQAESGIGSQGASNTLLGGVAALKGGLELLASQGGLGSAEDGVQRISNGLAPFVANGGALDQMVAALTAANADGCTATCAAVLPTIIGQVSGAKTQLNAAKVGADAVATGIAGAISQINSQMLPGADQLLGGLNQLLVGVQQLQGGAKQEKQGLEDVNAGLDNLSAGVAAAVSGVTELNAGAGSAYQGSVDLGDGLGQLNDGARQVNSGARKLSGGADAAASGGDQVADGARQLSDGLGSAATGSGQLADGLNQAASNTPQIVDGATRLSTEGMSQLIKAGKSTSMTYGELYAVIKAGADRAHVNSMAIGAPKGAEGLTAYSFTIKGDDGETGRNWTRGIAGVALVGLGAGALFYRRRFV